MLRNVSADIQQDDPDVSASMNLHDDLMVNDDNLLCKLDIFSYVLPFLRTPDLALASRACYALYVYINDYKDSILKNISKQSMDVIHKLDSVLQKVVERRVFDSDFADKLYLLNFLINASNDDAITRLKALYGKNLLEDIELEAMRVPFYVAVIFNVVSLNDLANLNKLECLNTNDPVSPFSYLIWAIDLHLIEIKALEKFYHQSIMDGPGKNFL